MLGLPFLSSMEISMIFSESDVEEGLVGVIPSILETTMSTKKAQMRRYHVPAEAYVYRLDATCTCSSNGCLCIDDGGRHLRTDSVSRGQRQGRGRGRGELGGGGKRKGKREDISYV